jgi:hypothetical protein
MLLISVCRYNYQYINISAYWHCTLQRILKVWWHTKCRSIWYPHNLQPVKTISLLLYNNSNYIKCCYSRLIHHLGARILMVISFTPRPLYLQDPFKRSLCGLLFRLASNGQEKALFLPSYPTKIRPFSCLYPDRCKVWANPAPISITRMADIMK